MLKEALEDVLKFIQNDYLKSFVFVHAMPKITQRTPCDALEAASQFFLRKSTKSLSATVSLCRDEFGQDALIIARSMFEISLTFAYILRPASRADKVKVAEQYIYREKSEQETVKKRILELLRSGACKEWLQQMPDIISSCQSSEINNPRRRGNLASVSAMAKALGEPYLCEYVFIYWSISHLVHSNPLSTHSYYGAQETSDHVRALQLAFDLHFRTLQMSLLAMEVQVGPTLAHIRDEFIRLFTPLIESIESNG